MSLILEALRKSEAERRRGNLPALALELPPPPPRTVPMRAWWLAFPLALVLAAAAYWMMRATPAPQPDPAQAHAHAVDTMDGADTSADISAAVVASAPGQRVAVPAPSDPVPGPVPTAPEFEPAPEPVPPPEPAPAVAAPDDPRAGDVPIFALADLTADERRALPPLKLSMHMWAPAPADRFVILDGHRLGEGDRAGSAVVARIDPDGVILAADGRRIRLPLP